MTGQPKRVGRPPEPVPQDKADAIIEWISHGKTLREWCRDNGVHYSTVYLWLEKDDGFAQRFGRARELGQEVIAEEALEITDTFPLMADSESGSRVDSGHVAWLKNRAEMRLKLLAKWNPKRWGDKVDLTSAGEKVGLAITIDLGGKA
jgi:hypothetical protein